MQPIATGTPPLVRVVNRHLILERLRRLGRVSRAELAKLTAIRPPTVSAIVRQLIEEGLVEEVGDGATETGTGRPPRMVALARSRARVLGFEVSASAIRVGLSRLDGTLVAQQRFPHAPDSPQRTVERLARLGDELLAGMSLAWSDLDGVGVALPGLVDPTRGMVRWSRPFDWHAVPLRDMCVARWGARTDVLNNAVAGSMAENAIGGGRDTPSLIYVYLRFDVVESDGGAAGEVVRLGSGIIINGEPYHGEFGAAGEITSLVEHPRRHARDDHGARFVNTDAFVAAFRAGQASAVAAMARVEHDIAAHVMDAINFLDPGMVVIDSDYAVLGEVVLRKLRDIVARDALREVVGRTRVVASELGEYGMVRGAVMPALDRIFRLPRLGKNQEVRDGAGSRPTAHG
jgi:N-acetylglucosamine repressor